MSSPDWSYSGDPENSPRDQVRFLIGDTDGADPQVLDKELDWLLAQSTNSGGTVNVYEAAIAACSTLAARYSRRANKTSGDLSVSAAEVAKHYRDLAGDMKRIAMRHSVPKPYSGGMRESDREIDREDDDLIQPEMSVGMDDDPGAASGAGFVQVVPGV